MPYCTHCGHQNPDDARFCSNCGTRLAAERPAGADVDVHDQLRRPRARRARTPTAAQPGRAGRGRRAPARQALLVVQRGPERRQPVPARHRTSTTAGRHPDSDIFLDDVTVSRRHASSPATPTASSSPTSAASTAPTSTATGSTTVAAARTATRCRSASTGWSTSRAAQRRESHGVTRDRADRRAASGCMTSGRCSPAARRVPRRHHLQDPLPRAEGLVEPERTPSGYRKFTHDDVERLRYVLAAQRDHYLPLRVIREHLDAMDRGLEPPPIEPACRRVPTRRPGRRRAARGRVRSARQRRAAAVPQRAAGDRRHRRRAARRARGVRPGRARARDRPLRRRRAGRSPRRSPRWPRSGSSRATCARSRPPPTARSGWSSRSSRRCARQRDAEAQARAEEPSREIAALSVRLHAALVTGLRELGAGSGSARGPLGRAARRRGSAGRHARGRRRRRPGGDAVEPAHRPAPGVDGGALPADLDRRRRGDRDRLRPAGRRAAPAADPRPAQGRARGTGHQLSEVRITELKDGVFYAVLVLRRRVEVSARPSDSIALALRTGSRIVCARRCSTRPASTIPDEQEDEVEKFREFLDQISPEDFEIRER